MPSNKSNISDNKQAGKRLKTLNRESESNKKPFSKIKREEI
jgi:hypothetical protein